MKGINKTNAIIASITLFALILVVFSACVSETKYRINSDGKNYYCNTYTVDLETKCIIIPADSCGCSTERGPIELCNPYTIYDNRDGSELEEHRKVYLPADESMSDAIDDSHNLNGDEYDIEDTTDYSIKED